jgi:glycosyltransferase involved in cell wall biosynthesis
MRYGQNPAKFILQVAHPQLVTVFVVTYIPFLEGYYAHSLDVLKVCLASILAHTNGAYDLVVFDNASCAEVVTYLCELKTAGRIQYLILSDKNVGKVGAWNVVFGAGLGEYIVYADSDVYFYPGWLEKHLEVFKAFPEAGTVSGIARRGRREFYHHTLELLGSLPNTQVEEGQFIPRDWMFEHLRSLGKEEELDEELQQHDYRVTRDGISAYASADHFQFMIKADTIRRYIPFPYDRPMGDSVHNLDKAINSSDMVRLAVAERVVRHLGNALDEETRREIPASLLPTSIKAVQTRRMGKTLSIVDWKPVKWVLLRLYDHIFRLYYRRRNQE